jgi:hypothetical protein
MHQITHAPMDEAALAPGEQLKSLMSYFIAFANWESQLRLHLLFIHGLAKYCTCKSPVISWPSARSIAALNMSLQHTKISISVLWLAHSIRKSKLLQPKGTKNKKGKKSYVFHVLIYKLVDLGGCCVSSLTISRLVTIMSGTSL